MKQKSHLPCFHKCTLVLKIYTEKQASTRKWLASHPSCISTPLVWLVAQVQKIFKYNRSKNIKVTFEIQLMTSQVLTKGLLLFNLSHPASNICKEIFIEILICFKCYQIEDHHTSSCSKSKDYKMRSLFSSLEHTHHECTSSNRKRRERS